LFTNYATRDAIHSAADPSRVRCVLQMKCECDYDDVRCSFPAWTTPELH